MAFSVYPDVYNVLSDGRRFSASSTSWRPFMVQGFHRVARLQGGVAEALDLGDDIPAHQRVVLHDQDDLVPAFDARGCLHLGGGLIEARCPRQIDLDGGAVTFLAVNLDMSVGLLDEAKHHAEAEPGALADIL